MESKNDEFRLSNWKTNDVANWLRKEGFERYVDLFVNQHKIDGLALELLSETDLRWARNQVGISPGIKTCFWLIFRRLS